ncbi:MAG: PAS domain S-box protein [Desulfobulbaceae bacterium]|nr:PAS domain S-box protein [Desulfobulbaceae bacterium]MDH3782614.1 PAS domain S-box protein [Desulfobulbaceae bacterium]
MSLLHEKHPANLILQEGQQCWQFFNCFKVLCDAHNNENIDCWLIPQTHCRNYIFDDYFEKISICLSCEYFKQKGSRHPQGHDFFIAEQLRNFNKKAFEQQFQKEESFVEILNRIPDGLFTFDKDWRIIYFNPAAEEITGFYAEDAVGMYCDDVFKITGTGSGNVLRQAINEGVDVHNREYEITDIGGRKIPVICSTSAFRNERGEVMGGLEIFKDITELKILQEEIVKREKKYRRIFEGSHDAIYTSTLEGNILDVNPAGVDMLGYPSKDELLQVGRANQLYKNIRDREKFIGLMNRDGYVKDFEVDFRRYDGAPIHALVSSRRYENPKTGGVEYEGIIKDITRRKQAEEIIQLRNQELSILNSIAVVLNFTMDLDHILMVTLERVRKILSVRKGGIFLFDDEGNTPTMRVGYCLPEATQENPAQIEFKDIMLMEYLVQKKAELEPEASFPSFQVRYTAGGEPSLWLTCYLITSKRKTVGFFGFESTKSKILSIQELHLLGSLGNLLGNAIENAKLMETIRQHRYELRRLTEKLFQGQEEERRRIARELHDEAGQSLTAVKLGLDRLEQKVPVENIALHNDLKDIRTMLVRTSSEIRRLSYKLHPTLLSDLGLEPALKLYFKEIRDHSNLDIHFNMIGFDKRMDKDLETALYRFSQEALTNTLKHSGAEIFNCKIIKSYPNLIFTAEDDGIGFDGKIENQDKRSLGLIGMRERTLLLGGAFQLKGRPGEGVRIRIEIPLPEEQA